MFHKLKTVGRKIYRDVPNQEGLIEGLGYQYVIPMMTDTKVKCKKPTNNESPVPTIYYFMSVTTIEVVTYIVYGTTAIYKTRNLLLSLFF